LKKDTMESPFSWYQLVPLLNSSSSRCQDPFYCLS
jgi:hypothetical protein